MHCDWTQRVSLLIDGELAPAEAHAAERHLDNCAACQGAREDFLSLRRQITAHEVKFDALAERRALKRILAAGNSGAKTGKEQAVFASPRWSERFAGRFSLPRLRPAALAASALLLIGFAVVINAYLKARHPQLELAKIVLPSAPQHETDHHDASSNQSPPVGTTSDPGATHQPDHTVAAVAGNESRRNRERHLSDAREIKRTSAGSAIKAGRIANARRKIPRSFAPPFFNQPPGSAPVIETANNEAETPENGADDDVRRSEFGATGESKTARHVEQAQVLLRSFRHLRLAETDGRAASSSGLAYDKRQSKKLLYQNIVLRREAASRGNVSIESVLDSLEPILLDIANLPDRPSPEVIRTINERMRRKNLVAMLQVNSGAPVARSY